MVGGLSLVRRLVPEKALDLPGVFKSYLNSGSHPRSCEPRAGCGGVWAFARTFSHTWKAGVLSPPTPTLQFRKQRCSGSEVPVSSLDRVTKTEIQIPQLLHRAGFPRRLCAMEERKGAVEVSGSGSWEMGQTIPFSPRVPVSLFQAEECEFQFQGTSLEQLAGTSYFANTG